MEALFQQILEVFRNLFDPPALIRVLEQKEIMLAAFVALAAIIFTETGLLVGFFLPGDSLLVTTGIVAWNADWPVHWLILLLCVAAIVGDSVGYAIGRKAGPRLFTKQKSFFFRADYIRKAQDFYVVHGAKTIILARFVPIIRTFAPVVAGVGRMDYRRFLMYNVVGGIGWVTSMVLLGYVLTPWLDGPLKKVFGPDFQVQKHVEKVILLVVFVSILPAIWAAWRERSKSKAAVAAAAGTDPLPVETRTPL